MYKYDSKAFYKVGGRTGEAFKGGLIRQNEYVSGAFANQTIIYDVKKHDNKTNESTINELCAALPIFNYLSAAGSVFTILDGIRDDRDLG